MSVLLLSFALIMTSLSLPETASAAGAEVKVAKAQFSEQHERDVDQVALASQENAISKLSGLLKKYRGTRQEPILLFKLGELQQQGSAIRFRIAHGLASKKNGTLDLSRYKKSMRQGIATLTELIRKYPHYQEIPQAYFMRAKGYEEVGDKGPATRDYLHLVKTWPDAPETIPAYMALAQFAIDDTNHALAVRYLKEVEKDPEGPHYPFALFKQAWAHYNLKDIPGALAYAERHITYYDKKLGRKDPDMNSLLSTSDHAFRENMLMDATTFYNEGYEQKIPAYTVQGALAYFRKLNNGKALGKMISRFAKLLRSHKHDAELNQWKDMILSSEGDRPESLEVVITTYEHQRNERQFDKVVASAQDMVRIYRKHKDFPAFAEARRHILETAEELQALTIKNKKAQGVEKLSSTLAAIYDAFTKVVDESDPRIPKVHYNLAETLFEIKDYNGATQHYRWVVDHGKWNSKNKEAASVVDASLKAISSRYETLLAGKLIPTSVAALSLTKSKPKKLDPLLDEWVQWIDTHIDRARDPIDNFYFEANRALYTQGHVQKAVERLTRFAKDHPSSRFSMPSASLVLDTYVATADWKKAHELSHDYLEVKEYEGTDFAKRLFAIAADSSYKMIEEVYKAKDYDETLDRVDDFLKRYATTERFADCLTLAGNAAMALNKKEKAQQYYTRLINEAPKSSTIGTALAARAVMHEERYEFAQAARDYRSWLGLPVELRKGDEDEADKLRLKTLALAWISADLNELRSTLDNKTVCTESLARECDQYKALMALQTPGEAGRKDVTSKAFDEARKGYKANKALWAAIALEGAKSLAWRDRNLMLRQLADGWEDLEPLVQFALIRTISESVPKALQMNRVAMREVAPLRAHERWIADRVYKIREMENAATRVMKKLPWARVRALTLNEVAGLYLDISSGLMQLAPPKGLPPEELAVYEATIRKLVIPFEEKGQEIRMKAFEIASKFAIENEAFALVADPFFQDNPSQAQALKPKDPYPAPGALDLVMLDQLDPSGKWRSLKEDKDEPAMTLKFKWAASLKAGVSQQIAFFMQEAQEKSLLREGVQDGMRAVALSTMGARGEALVELESAVKHLGGGERISALRLLFAHYQASFAQDKAKDLMKQIEKQKTEVAKR